MQAHTLVSTPPQDSVGKPNKLTGPQTPACLGLVVGTLRGGADIALLSAKEGILVTVVNS